MIKRQIKAIFILCIFFPASIANAKDADKNNTSYFNEQWMKTVVSIEIAQASGEAKPIGTGFLVGTPNKHILLVTAKHVIFGNEGKILENLACRLNEKSGKSILLTDKIFLELGGGKWFVSEDSDVACRFIYGRKTSDVFFIPLDMFLGSSRLNVAAPLIILGFPMGLRSDEFAVPIARRAMVARSDPKIVIVDGFVFPGNSGGPVIYCPAIKVGKGMTSGVLNDQRLIGLVSKSLNYVDIAVSEQSKIPRISFIDNTGLSIVIPADAILELINRDDVTKFDNELK